MRSFASGQGTRRYDEPVSEFSPRPELEPDFPPELSIALYRIVQEALTNVVKYAKAKNVNVELLRTDAGVSVIFEDDGIGLPAGAETNALSHGISGMRQRIRALKGEFRIHGRPGVGTTIEVHVPLSPQLGPAKPPAPPEG